MLVVVVVVAAVATVMEEKVMDPNFGVCVRNYLFSSYHEGVEIEIRNRIFEQAATYLPMVTITDVSMRTSDPDRNTLGISISYKIPEIGIRDLFELTI